MPLSGSVQPLKSGSVIVANCWAAIWFMRISGRPWSGKPSGPSSTWLGSCSISVPFWQSAPLFCDGRNSRPAPYVPATQGITAYSSLFGGAGGSGGAVVAAEAVFVARLFRFFLHGRRQ